jgi:hypothetical protein
MMSILLTGAGSGLAESGPFEKFFRTLKHAFSSKPQQKGRSRGSQREHKGATATPTPTTTPIAAATLGVSGPPTELNTRAATRAASNRGDDLRYGTPVPGKNGFVTSPFSPNSGYIDVRGFVPGTPVKDPYTGKVFLTP